MGTPLLLRKAFQNTFFAAKWNSVYFRRLVLIEFLSLTKSSKKISRCQFSVPRWIDCLFNFRPFKAMKIGPIEYKINQSKLKIFPNTTWTLSKWPKIFNTMTEWSNFAKSGHTFYDDNLSSKKALTTSMENCRTWNTLNFAFRKLLHTWCEFL